MTWIMIAANHQLLEDEVLQINVGESQLALFRS